MRALSPGSMRLANWSPSRPFPSPGEGGSLVLGPEYPAEQVCHGVHDLPESGVQMAEQGQGQGPRHPGIQVTGSRADEQAVRGAQHLFHRGLVQGFHACFLLRLTLVSGANLPLSI